MQRNSEPAASASSSPGLSLSLGRPTTTLGAPGPTNARPLSPGPFTSKLRPVGGGRAASPSPERAGGGARLGRGLLAPPREDGKRRGVSPTPLGNLKRSQETEQGMLAGL